jgi:serine/threonine-protein kinase
MNEKPTASKPTPVQVRKPVTFGKYTLLERIAVGGMAEVFLAVQTGLEGFEKWLAIKRIRPHLSNEEAFVKMFLNEAKLAAQLQHPNIVQIFDLGKINDSFFIAMEYISGRDMSRVIPKAEKNGIPFPFEYALSIAASVLDGLSYAHPKTDAFGVPLNIVHRDITPENIMVAWAGNVKILDFGIAKAATQSDQTRAGEIKGKLSYMSPEQAMGKALDSRSDLFALGIVLYEWVTGYRLFTGENEMAILKSIIDGKIYPPSYFREDVPERIEEILMRALAKDREDRYQTARDMQLDILQWFTEVGFTPTSVHLANFMKQLFGDEIAGEQKALASAARDSKRAANSTPPPPKSDKAQVGDAVGVAKPRDASSEKQNGAALIVVDAASQLGTAPISGEGRLSIQLGPAEYERLKAAAQRSGVAVEQVVQDILRSTLKYL